MFKLPLQSFRVLVALSLILPFSKALPNARVDVDFTEIPGSQLLRLEKTHDGKTWHCSATLVAPSIILSAAHCFQVGKGGIFDGKVTPDAKVQVHYTHGKFKAEANVIKVLVGALYEEYSLPLAGNDWALGVLDKALGNKFGWIQLSPIALQLGMKISAAGYSNDHQKGQHPGIHKGCELVDPRTKAASALARIGLPVDNFYMTNCEIGPGASGGPMYTNDLVYTSENGQRMQIPAIAAVNTNLDGTSGKTVGVTVRDAYPKWLLLVLLQVFGNLHEYVTEDRVDTGNLNPIFKEWEKLSNTRRVDLIVHHLPSTAHQQAALRALTDLLQKQLQGKVKYVIGVNTTAFAPMEIKEILSNSVAEKAGLKVGDTIEAMNREEWPSIWEFRRYLNHSSGEAFTLKVRRKGVEKEFSLTPDRG